MYLISKKIITVCFLSVFVIHFTFVFFATSPLKINGKPTTISKFYCYPFFYQTWSLFAPAPTINYQLFVRYKTNVGFTNWQNIFENALQRHKKNKLVGNENIMLLFSNSLNYAISNMQTKSVIKLNATTTSQTILLFEVNQYLKLNHQLKKGNEFECIVFANKSKSPVANYFVNQKIN